MPRHDSFVNTGNKTQEAAGEGKVEQASVKSGRLLIRVLEDRGTQKSVFQVRKKRIVYCGAIAGKTVLLK